jgi:hypothetical protein
MNEKKRKVKSGIKNQASKKNLPKGYNVGDELADTVDSIFDQQIKSGEIFKINTYDITRLMDVKTKLNFFERIDSTNKAELILDFKLDHTMINNWFNEYKNYRILLKASDKRFTYKSTTAVQVIHTLHAF